MKVWETIRANHAAKRHWITTTELIAIIVVIGILLGLIIATQTSNAEQQKNTERKRDISELHVELESYYSQYSKYPTLAELNNITWRTTYMKGVTTQVFRDPSGTSYHLVTMPTKNVYAYHATSATGTACNDTTTPCLQYTLTTTLEGGTTYVQNNLN